MKEYNLVLDFSKCKTKEDVERVLKGKEKELTEIQKAIKSMNL